MSGGDFWCFTFSTINIQDTTTAQSQSTETEPLQPSILQTQETRELTSMVQHQRTEQVNPRLSEEQQLRESTTIAEPQPPKPLDSCTLHVITRESSV
jgi:t-SNARE complex subunit (syntaxin)